MSQDEPQDSAAAEIRFDRADFGAAGSDASCAVCNERLAGSYFEINGVMVCEPCRAKVGNAAGQGSRAGRLFRALAGGLGAAVLGAGIYYAVLAITNYEIGLIAIVVGFLVGGAVRWGSYGRGGWGYQALAMTLTYVAIVSTYVPFLFKAAAEQGSKATAASSTEAPVAKASTADAPAQAAGASASATSPAAPVKPGDSPSAGPAVKGEPPMSLGKFLFSLVTMVGIVLALPFLAGFENFMGWLIIGFAVYQAWKMNRARRLVVTGPFRLAPAGTAAPARAAGDGEASVPPPPALEPA